MCGCVFVVGVWVRLALVWVCGWVGDFGRLWGLTHHHSTPHACIHTSAVGYMAGPLATIYDVYKTEAMSKKIAAPIWVVFISAFSLVVGLATYGYNSEWGVLNVCAEWRRVPSRRRASSSSYAPPPVPPPIDGIGPPPPPG